MLERIDGAWVGVAFDFTNLKRAIIAMTSTRAEMEQVVAESYPPPWEVCIIDLHNVRRAIQNDLTLFLADHDIVGSELRETLYDVYSNILTAIDKLRSGEGKRRGVGDGKTG